MAIICPQCRTENNDASEACASCRFPFTESRTLIHDRYSMTKPWIFSTFKAVYQAEDVRDNNRIYSIREFLPQFILPSERLLVRSHFEATMQKYRELSHRNMTRITDFFVEGNYFYVVYDYVNGLDMTKYLDSHKIVREKGYPERLVSNWAVQLCDLLEYLHHGFSEPFYAVDLKPAGVVFRQEDESVVFIDNGIYRLLQILGPHYIITEDFHAYRKASGKFESVKWDLFCVGNIMYYLLTGIDLIKMPDNLGVPQLKNIRPDLSDAMIKVVMKAVGVKAQSGYDRASDLREDLKEMVPPLPLKAFDFYRDFVKKEEAEGKTEWRMLLGNETRSGRSGTAPRVPLRMKWKTMLKPSNNYFLSAAGDYVYATSREGMVTGIHRDLKDTEWKFYISKQVSTYGIASENMIYYATPFQELVAVERGKNNFRWKLQLETPCMSTPVLYEGIVFLSLYNGKTIAVSAEEGKILATFVIEGNILSSPIVYSNVLYVASLNKLICAIDVETEQTIWKYETDTGFSSSPTLCGNKLFIGSHDGTLCAISIQSGNPIWTRNFRGSITQSVRATDDMIFLITTAGKLLALDPSRGDTIWEKDIGGKEFEYPFALGENLVYLVDQDKNFKCIDFFTGQERQSFKMSHTSASQLMCAHNQIYLVSKAGHLVAFGK
ncbi:MAG: PQQ-binding-like beta-propeller repeat protein [Firmicutes bacterium]|nr:PQQ-binding-like beta-propeller repeat protein [Bacillota bacterium]